MTALKLNPAVTSLEEEGAFFVLDKAMRLKAEGHPVINLGIGQPDFAPPAHVIEAGLKAVKDGPHGYTSPVGMPALREAVADSVGRRYGLTIPAGRVIIVPGGKVTIFFACMVFGGQGREILYPDPGFPPYREAVKAASAKPVPYPIREDRNFGFDADEVLSLITPDTGLIIINSPANPTGGVVDRVELDKLAEGLKHHPHVAILSDEIYSHLVFEGSGFQSLMQYPHLADRVVLLDGWSKTFAMTGWRLGYGIWPEATVEAVRGLITVDHSCVNVAAQMAGLAAITGPMDEIDAMRETFMRRRDLVVDRLNAMPGVTCRVPGGAFYAFPNVRGTGVESKLLAERLLMEAHVALIPGDSFGENGKGYLRVSYAASTGELDEALGRMNQLLSAS
ncbi:MAG: pyridoxal phosphate-dependent aminotransferase [Anderseniella sp.]|nr:pyridoxal phosphate-dependent aminotransferase [Anderseniella sp.]